MKLEVHMKAMKHLAFFLIWLVLLTGCNSHQQGGLPEMVDVTQITAEEATARVVDQGFGTTAHDPTIIQDPQSKRYYLFTTGPGIPVQASDDLKNWKLIGPAISPTPGWVRKAVPKVGDLWAPDVKLYNGKYYLLYSASSFGKNTSAIGLASNKSLDPQSPDFAWVDEGAVITSAPGDNFNAIDPNLTFDEKGQPWLAFGSFWGGIMLRRLDPQTLKPPSGNDEIFTIADRGIPPNSIEGEYLLQIGKYFYLFVSHDFCCRGVDSTYKIKVGRAEHITGPYLDREGVDLANNGGTLVLESSERWKGPGHNSILVDGEHYYLVYHAYDALAGGAPSLHVEELFWDLEGWPVAPSAILDGQVK